MIIRKTIRKIAAILCVILCMCTPVLASEAVSEETTAVNLSSSVKVILAYKFKDGSVDVWDSCNGVVIGDSAVVTLKETAYPEKTDELYTSIINEKLSLYDRLGIDLDDIDTVRDSLVIYVVSGKGEVTEGSVEQTSSNLALLSIESGSVSSEAAEITESWANKMFVCGYDSLTLAEAEEALADGTTYKGTRQSISTEETISSNFLVMPDNVDEGLEGSGVYTKSGKLGAIITDVSGKILTVVTASQIEEFVSGDNSETSADELVALKLEELETLVAEVKTEDLSGYTAESTEVLNTAIEAAEQVLSNVYATADEIDASIEELSAARSSLVLDESEPEINITKIAAVICVFVVVLFIVVVLFVMFRKKNTDGKTKKKEEKKEKDTGYGGEYARQFDEDNGDDTTVLDEGLADTLLLDQKVGIPAYLERDNGARINITKKNFVIGKERRKVTYCITGNGTVSRRHCVIKECDEGYTIEDLNSLNGTFVNNVKISRGDPTLLGDGDSITLSDVNFIFHMGEPES